MQAASVDIQSSIPPPPAERSAAPAKPGAGSDIRSGVSFRALLARSIRDLVKPNPDSRPGNRAGAGVPMPEAGRVSNRRRALRENANAAAAKKSRAESRDPGLPGDPASPTPRRAGGPGPVDPPEPSVSAPGAGLSAAASNNAAAPVAGSAARDPSGPDGAEARPAARDRKASQPPAEEGAPDSTTAPNPGPGAAARREVPAASSEESAAEGAGTVRRRADRKDAKVSVVDLRMRPANPDSEPGRDASRPDEASPAMKDPHPSGTRTAEGSAPSERAPVPKPAAGTGFSDILARHLTDSGAQDIVKAAQIVLRDGDAGLIRLRLEPDSLGSVKIELKMSEKNITGRIVVETDEARSAFEKSLSGLRDAFTEGGFETASLEVSVGGGQAESGEDPSGTSKEPFFTERLRGLERSQPAAADSGYARDGTVNLWA